MNTLLRCLCTPYTNEYHRLTQLIIFFQKLEIQINNVNCDWKELFISELCWYFVFNGKQHIFNELFRNFKNMHSLKTQMKEYNIFNLWDMLPRSDQRKFFEVFKEFEKSCNTIS